jgi:site-specific recombinase XerD
MDYANATKNDIHMAVGQVFELLKNDTGMENPFRKIEKLSTETEGHEAYELDEIKVILQKCDSFLRPLFLVGFFTGLRLGDICTLRKDEIDFESRFIRRIQGKTGVLVSIPMSQPLYQYLSHSATLSDGEYLFPELCRQVKENSKGMICNRVKKFLNEEIGIVTQKTVEGRARKINLKGIHSLRHTFCSIAGMAGIPLPVVQSIVGHMTEKMTEYYSRHIDDETKARYMTFFGNHISMITSGNGDSASLPDMGHGLFILPDHNIKKEKSLDSLLMEKISLLSESQKKDLLEKLEDPSFLEDEKSHVSVISEPPQKAENKLNPLMVYGGRLASVLGMLFKKNPA